MTILFYKSVPPHGYMNNFYPTRFYIYGRWWDTVEHAYQAQKTENVAAYDIIHAAKGPRMARDLGQLVPMKSNWNEIKYSVMKDCVRAKFLQHPDLRKQLISTGDEEIVEDSPIDSYWGRGPDWQGQNNLGKILMEIRLELAGE